MAALHLDAPVTGPVAQPCWTLLCAATCPGAPAREGGGGRAAHRAMADATPAPGPRRDCRPRGAPAVALCLELTSPARPAAHRRPRPRRRPRACSATRLRPPSRRRRRRDGLVVDVAALTDPDTAEHMPSDVLSSASGWALARGAPLARLARPRRGDWAAGPPRAHHRRRRRVGRAPGRALDPSSAAAERLDQRPAALTASHEVLAEQGNCSSATGRRGRGVEAKLPPTQGFDLSETSGPRSAAPRGPSAARRSRTGPPASPRRARSGPRRGSAPPGAGSGARTPGALSGSGAAR